MQFVAQSLSQKFWFRQAWKLRFANSVAIAGILLTVVNQTAVAQRRPVADETLGDERSIVSPDVINGREGDRIEGGARRGENLFHSFREFSVDEGRSAYFSNPSGIRNILSRVTGSNVSEILGVLGVLGDANLFLLNPNGIIFGPNAQLDVRGSFLASTGDRFSFADGSEFSATNPQSAPLLTVSITPGLQYGTGRGDLSNAANLALRAGQSLTLYGGTVTSTGILTAPGGRVEVLGDRVALLDNARIDVSGEMGGGTVLIGGDYRGQGTVPNALRTYVAPGVTISANALSNGSGGRVIVWAEEATEFYGNISARGGDTSGNGGFVEVSGRQNLAFDGLVDTYAPRGQAGQLFLDPEDVIIGTSTTNNAELDDGQILNGDGGIDSIFVVSARAVETALNRGNVDISATNTININRGITIDSPNDLTLRAATINLNNIYIWQFGEGNIVLNTTQNAGTPAETILGTSIVMRNAEIRQQVPSGASYDGGNILITTGSLDSNRSLLGTITSGSGNGGAVDIRTASLSLSDRALIGSSTFGQGNSGNITLIAGSLDIRDGASLRTITNGSGNGGAVDIRAASLSLSNGASIDSQTSHQGNAGNITLNIDDHISVNTRPGTGILSGTRGEGNAGNITIEAGSLRLVGGAQVSSSTLGQGGNANGGDITLNIRGAISAEDLGSGIFSTVNSENGIQGEGNAGNIILNAETLILSRGSAVNSTTYGLGNSGNITLEVRDAISLNGGDSMGRSAPRSGIFSQVGDNGYYDAVGKGGNITIDAGSLSLLNGSAISTSTLAQGDAGNIVLNMRGDISVDGVGLDNNSGIFSEVRGKGNSGRIIVRDASSILLTNGGSIETSTYGIGNAGDITVNARGDISADGSGDALLGQVFLSGIFSINGDESTIGNGGNIAITSSSLRLTNGAEISSSTFGEGNAGRITLQMQDAISADGEESQGRGRVSGIFSLVGDTGQGDAGSIILTANSLNLANRGQISSQTDGQGNASDITINSNTINLQNGAAISALASSSGTGGSINLSASQSVALNGNSSLSAETSNVGAAGSILISTPQLTVDLSNITVRSVGTSEAGNLALNARDVFLNQGSITGTTEAGNGGAINLTIVESLRLNNNSQLSASTQSGRGGDVTIQDLNSLQVLNSFISAESETGTAGVLNINASDSILLRGNRGGLSVRSNGGDAGNLRVTTNQLNIRDGASIAVSNTGQGDGGDLTINARNVSLNQGRITGTTVAGRGGDLNLNVGESLRLDNNSEISASTRSGEGGDIRLQDLSTLQVLDSLISAESKTGRAGRLRINASNSVLLDGRGNRNRGGLSVRSRGGRRAGTLTVNTNELNIRDRAAIAVSNTGQGDAGNLTLNARDVSLDRGSITGETASGRGGDIKLNNLDSLHLNNRSEVSASTATGQGGSLSINTRTGGDLTLTSDSNLAAEAIGRSGTAGSLEVNNVDNLTVEESGMTVSSTEGVAGDLRISADSVTLDNGSLTAIAGAGNGGNITVDASGDLLQLSNESRISAQALEGADGGNVALRVPDGFVIANPFENSDIVASAERGNGGRVDVNALQIFGLAERVGDTPLSDINVSSTFGTSGAIELNTLNVDPSQGVAALPETVVTPDQVDQRCVTRSGGAGAQGEFVVSGRGGLPPDADESLGNDAVQVDLVTAEEEAETRVNRAVLLPEIGDTDGAIVEAQEWVVDTDGNVVLTASTSAGIPHSPQLRPIQCPAQ